MKVSVSMSDFPVFSRVKTAFKEFKSSGVDSVELNIGLKSRWSFEKINTLSRQYQLPIASIHQPVWSGLRIAFDENFVTHAVKHGITKIVFHPLCFLPIHSKKMRRYFERVSEIQKKYGITVLLENMPNNQSPTAIDYWAMDKSTSVLTNIFAVAEEFNFKMTFDTSHAKLIRPQEDAIFKKIFPKIGNIHLSSFHQNREHLPLIMGDFDTKGFITYLVRKKYKGLLTLEIFYPKTFPLVRRYDSSAIAKSVALVKEIADRS